jgi:tetratricopeptide (TPR) repeat protein
VSGLLEVRLRDFAAADHGARALHAVRGAQPVEALARLLAATLRADALRAADRPADALAVLERAPDEVPTELAGALGVGPYSAWLRAEVLRALGRDEEALAWYASRTDLFVGELIYLAPASLRAGEIHERRGEYARAVSSYRRFLGLWAGADVELRPLVEATHAASSGSARTSRPQHAVVAHRDRDAFLTSAASRRRAALTGARSRRGRVVSREPACWIRSRTVSAQASRITSHRPAAAETCTTPPRELASRGTPLRARWAGGP